MNRDYSDLLAGRVPTWCDDNAVPRFVEFHPNLCDVYARVVALIEIECQNCGKKFVVAREFTCPPSAVFEHDPVLLADRLHYGDPPNHGCIGDSMNSIPKRCIEMWLRDPEWHRVSEYEVELKPDWMEIGLL